MIDNYLNITSESIVNVQIINGIEYKKLKSQGKTFNKIISPF